MVNGHDEPVSLHKILMANKLWLKFWGSCHLEFSFADAELEINFFPKTIEVTGSKNKSLFFRFNIFQSIFQPIKCRHVCMSACLSLVLAFITSRLDYNCNSLLYGIPKEQIAKLQCIQNAAARLVVDIGTYYCCLV